MNNQNQAATNSQQMIRPTAGMPGPAAVAGHNVPTGNPVSAPTRIINGYVVTPVANYEPPPSVATNVPAAAPSISPICTQPSTEGEVDHWHTPQGVARRYREHAAHRGDPLLASVGVLNAGLMDLAYTFQAAIAASLASSKSPVKRLEKLLPLIDGQLRVLRQVERRRLLPERPSLCNRFVNRVEFPIPGYCVAQALVSLKAQIPMAKRRTAPLFRPRERRGPKMC